MTTAVAKNDKPSLAALIQQMKPEIAKALPSQMNPERMARIATTVVRQTPTLARCTPESFLGALLTASQLGLEPGPTGEAYFVPYGQVCTFIPGYRGLIKLARNSGLVSDIYAEIVYENDTYKVTRGLDRNIVHEEADGDRGKPSNVYAVAKFKDGERTFVTMSVAEVEKIRKRSKASGNGPWVTDWEAMAKKTAVKQLSKWLPLSAEFNAAVTLDGTVRTQVGPLVDVQPDYDVDGEVVGESVAIEQGDEQPPAEPSTETAPPADGPPADVMMASKAQLAKLKSLRASQGYDGDDAGWYSLIGGIAKHAIKSDNDITADGADAILQVFQEEAGR